MINRKQKHNAKIKQRQLKKNVNLSIPFQLHKFYDQLLQHKNIRSINVHSLYRTKHKVFPILPKDGLGIHGGLDLMVQNIIFSSLKTFHAFI